MSTIDSELFSQNYYIKQYLLGPDSLLITKIKIGFHYSIMVQPDLILQLIVFKGYLKKINPLYFGGYLVKIVKTEKYGNIWILNDICGERTLFRELRAQIVIHLSHRDRNF